MRLRYPESRRPSRVDASSSEARGGVRGASAEATSASSSTRVPPVPTLVIAGLHDPLVKIANAPRLAVLSHVDAVTVPGAHALNYSDPQLIAELIEAHMAGEPLWTQTGRKSVVGLVSVKGG